MMSLVIKQSHCNSFEVRAPVNFIYGCPIFQWVAETWLSKRVPEVVPSMAARSHVPWTPLSAMLPGTCSVDRGSCSLAGTHVCEDSVPLGYYICHCRYGYSGSRCEIGERPNVWFYTNVSHKCRLSIVKFTLPYGRRIYNGNYLLLKGWLGLSFKCARHLNKYRIALIDVSHPFAVSSWFQE